MAKPKKIVREKRFSEDALRRDRNTFKLYVSESTKVAQEYALFFTWRYIPLS